MLRRVDHGFGDIRETALNAAISGSTLTHPEACLASRMALLLSLSSAIDQAGGGDVFDGDADRLEHDCATLWRLDLAGKDLSDLGMDGHLGQDYVTRLLEHSLA